MVPKWPWPGKMIFSAARKRFGLVHHLGRVSEVLDGLQHRAHIAGAVVE